jgi:hypothetical protein
MGPLTPTLSPQAGRGGQLARFRNPSPRLRGEGGERSEPGEGSYASLPGSAIAADHGDITSVMP